MVKITKNWINTPRNSPIKVTMLLMMILIFYSLLVSWKNQTKCPVNGKVMFGKDKGKFQRGKQFPGLISWKESKMCCTQTLWMNSVLTQPGALMSPTAQNVIFCNSQHFSRCYKWRRHGFLVMAGLEVISFYLSVYLAEKSASTDLNLLQLSGRFSYGENSRVNHGIALFPETRKSPFVPF